MEIAILYKNIKELENLITNDDLEWIIKQMDTVGKTSIKNELQFQVKDV